MGANLAGKATRPVARAASQAARAGPCTLTPRVAGTELDEDFVVVPPAVGRLSESELVEHANAILRGPVGYSEGPTRVEDEEGNLISGEPSSDPESRGSGDHFDEAGADAAIRGQTSRGAPAAEHRRAFSASFAALAHRLASDEELQRRTLESPEFEQLRALIGASDSLLVAGPGALPAPPAGAPTGSPGALLWSALRSLWDDLRRGAQLTAGFVRDRVRELAHAVVRGVLAARDDIAAKGPPALDGSAGARAMYDAAVLVAVSAVIMTALPGVAGMRFARHARAAALAGGVAAAAGRAQLAGCLAGAPAPGCAFPRSPSGDSLVPVTLRASSDADADEPLSGGSLSSSTPGMLSVLSRT